MIIKRYILRKSQGPTSLRLSPQAKLVACAPAEIESVQLWIEMPNDEPDASMRNLRTFKLVSDSEWYDANWQHRASSISPQSCYETLHVIEWATPERTTARATR